METRQYEILQTIKPPRHFYIYKGWLKLLNNVKYLSVNQVQEIVLTLHHNIAFYSLQ